MIIADTSALITLATADSIQLVLKALVKRGVLINEEAEERIEQLAEAQDWLGRPIYRRARQFFD